MNWYKKALNTEEVKDHWEKCLGLGEYQSPPMTDEDRKKQKENRKPRDPEHSMDMGEYEGDDDGW